MSKSANSGELRTDVVFKRVAATSNENGFPSDAETNVFGEGASVKCKWVNYHGNEVWTAMQLKLRDPATITLRYSPLLEDETLILYRGNDPSPYEVISIDNVEGKNTWLEIKVQRKEAAR